MEYKSKLPPITKNKSCQNFHQPKPTTQTVDSSGGSSHKISKSKWSIIINENNDDPKIAPLYKKSSRQKQFSGSGHSGSINQ
jgi:hypothetical protein